MVYVLEEHFFRDSGLERRGKKTMRPFYQGYSSSFLRTVSRSLNLPLRLAMGLCCTLVVPILLATVASCSNSALHSEQRHNPSPSGFRIDSTAFRKGHSIPAVFTAEGEMASLPLR